MNNRVLQYKSQIPFIYRKIDLSIFNCNHWIKERSENFSLIFTMIIFFRLRRLSRIYNKRSTLSLFRVRGLGHSILVYNPIRTVESLRRLQNLMKSNAL